MDINTEQLAIVFVDKIRSYQTLVYKNGARTFRKKAYTEYANEIIPQLKELTPIEKYYGIEVIFVSKTLVLGDCENVMKPIPDILEDIKVVANDKYCLDMTIKRRFNKKMDKSYMIIKIKSLENAIDYTPDLGGLK